MANKKNFAIIGAAGYIAKRHMGAIRDTGNRIVAAYDPNDSIGILDSYFLDTKYFKEFERFERFLEKLKTAPEKNRVHYVSVCSPNYLHDVHTRFAMSKGADVICEKPLTINPWNLKSIKDAERKYKKTVYNVLQLRLHPKIIELKEKMKRDNKSSLHQVNLTYITARGNWYDYSWKGDEERSGGIAMNIGVHFFDMLIWLFGKPEMSKVYVRNSRKLCGYTKLARAEVKWYLSLDYKDLPFKPIPGQKTTHRSIKIDDQEVDFTSGFEDLHTKLYEEVLKGKGFLIRDVKPVIDLVYDIRNTSISEADHHTHDLL